jgi:glycosyltransferase involved in cell wall biosynthesis/SAM-dependent methyltransferase
LHSDLLGEVHSQATGPCRSTVAIIITTYNHAHFLPEALESCRSQTTLTDEIIVVDDGSTDDPAAVVARYEGVRIIRQANQGLAAARNAGLATTDATFVTFLDADDRLLREAIEFGVRQLTAHADAAFAYGAHRMIDGDGQPISAKIHYPLSDEPWLQFFRQGNFIGMHATVLYRRNLLIALGGFDESLPCCEDYELFMRIAKKLPIVSYDHLVAEYRMHGQNMSKNYPLMLKTVLRVMEEKRRDGGTEEVSVAQAEGQKFWKNYYAGLQVKNGLDLLRSRPFMASKVLLKSFEMDPATAVRKIGTTIKRQLSPSLRHRFRTAYRLVKRNTIHFGDFDRTSPFSKVFGFDRGQPIDRYYIEAFLTRHSSDIRGRVLEIGDNSYTIRFGGPKVTRSDVLHINAGHPGATIVGDLSDPATLPADAFDCVILTQTLHLIFDMQKAVAALEHSLKPDGVLLLTTPGISPIDRGEWKRSWYWSLTEQALGRLLEPVFDRKDISIETFGNVFAAVCFLQGLAVDEVQTAKLDILDEAFPIVIAARAVKKRK